MLCKYKNIFGKPGEGAHSYRLFNFAIVDIICTIIGGYTISYFFKTSPIYTIIIAFIVGIIAHELFCVKTTLNKFLFT